MSFVAELPTLSTADRPKVTLAYVIHSMNVGGAERSIARLINALDHKRFRPIVICLAHTGPAANWIESPEVPVIEINRKQRMFDCQAFHRFVKVLTDHRVDLIHSHNWGTLMESTLARRKAGVTAHVHAERGTVLSGIEMSGIKMHLRAVCARWAMKRCDEIVTNANSVAQRVEERCGFAACKVRVIPNGVEKLAWSMTEEERIQRRVELGIHDGALVVGSVGRLTEVKGFDLAVHAIACLAKDGHDLYLLLVGDGPLRSTLSTLANDLGIADRIHFAGHQNDVASWYPMMDVYVNCSHSEGMSQSLVEAMSSERPIIATNVGDTIVAIGDSGECGKLINAGSIEELIEAIKQLLPIDERNRMARNAGFKYRSEFTTKQMAKRYTNLYENILSRRVTPLSQKDSVN